MNDLFLLTVLFLLPAVFLVLSMIKPSLRDFFELSLAGAVYPVWAQWGMGAGVSMLVFAAGVIAFLNFLTVVTYLERRSGALLFCKAFLKMVIPSAFLAWCLILLIMAMRLF